MHRRSTARITVVSDDLLQKGIKLPLTWKNRNYVNSIFGGSMFTAVDPIPMLQLMHLSGDDYIVWDRSAEIKFKIPAEETLYADFTCANQEVETIKQRLEKEDEIEIIKTTELTNKDKSITYCLVYKTIYITTKDFYKDKLKKRKPELGNIFR